MAGWAGPPFGGLAAGRSVRPQGLAQAHCIQGCGEVPGAWRTWPEMRTQAETGRRAQALGPWGWSWVGGRGAGGFGAAFPAGPAPWSARGPAQPCFPGPQEAAGSRRGAVRTPHPASAAPQPPRGSGSGVPRGPLDVGPGVGCGVRAWRDGAGGPSTCGGGAGVEGRRCAPGASFAALPGAWSRGQASPPDRGAARGARRLGPQGREADATAGRGRVRRRRRVAGGSGGRLCGRLTGPLAGPRVTRGRDTDVRAAGPPRPPAAPARRFRSCQQRSLSARLF